MNRNYNNIKKINLQVCFSVLYFEIMCTCVNAYVCNKYIYLKFLNLQATFEIEIPYSINY